MARKPEKICVYSDSWFKFSPERRKEIEEMGLDNYFKFCFLFSVRSYLYLRHDSVYTKMSLEEINNSLPSMSDSLFNDIINSFENKMWSYLKSNIDDFCSKERYKTSCLSSYYVVFADIENNNKHYPGIKSFYRTNALFTDIKTSHDSIDVYIIGNAFVIEGFHKGGKNTFTVKQMTWPNAYVIHNYITKKSKPTIEKVVEDKDDEYTKNPKFVVKLKSSLKNNLNIFGWYKNERIFFAV